MASRLLLIAAFLISAAPPKSADYQRCITIHNGPIKDIENQIPGNAPVSDLS